MTGGMQRAPRRTMMRTLLALVLVAGVARADGPPPQMSAADTTKWLTFFDKLVDTVVKTSGTCDRMATDVNRVIEANKDAVAIARTAHAQGKKLPQAAQQRMMEGVKKMVPGMQKCGQHDKVRAAFAKLDLTRKDAAARR